MLENEDSKIMVFEPTLEEFKDFPKYISYMESKGAHHGGIAKVIPPKEWRATRDYNMKRIGEIVIKTPVTQTITGQQGVFQLFNISNKPITVKDFKELAESHKYKTPKSDPEDLERKFWKNLTFNPPIYGADVPGTIYDEDCEYWNINNLGTILDILNKSCKIKIKGVNTAYLYFGMWKTTFPWHTEDMDLYSINYLHFGEPKSWYAIPPEHGKRLETLAKGYFSGCALDCSEFLRHKMAIISPQVLRKFSIPFNKMTQYKNEFIITFPFGYHAGYNHGFNCAESTNFASERWIDFGKKAQHCKCILDSVKIDMDVFIKNYQPNQWKEILQQRQNQNSNSSSIKSNKKPKVRNIIQSSSDSKECSSESDSTQSSEEGFDYKQEDTQLELQEIPKKRLKIHEATFKKASSKKLNQRVNKTFQSAHSNVFENTNKSKLKTTKKGVSIPLVWSHQPFAVDKEIVYNRFISSAAVRCAVCVYFSQNDSEFLHMGSVLNQTTEKKILVTELCYAKNPSKETNIEVAYDYIFSGEEASKHVILLECCECALKVHSICYGVSPENIAKNWVCDKCYFLKNENVSATNVSLANEGNNNSNESIQHNCLSQSNYNISCCLCCLRGGALKQTTEGGWCHIVCAIAFPDVTFANISARGPINVSNLDPARKKLSCMYCSPLKNPSNHMGACLQCKCRKCAISFHVTCSFHNGIPLRFGNWPTLIEVACPKHVRQKFQNVSEPKEKPNVAHGDFVVAKHKNGRYYKGKVLETTMVLYYKVVFQDKSFCFDLPPEDIKNVDAENSILLPGTNVDVLWPSDSVTYPAEVLGHHYECHCQVSFEDGSILSIKRSDLYTLNEELPMRVKKKLSYASETQNKFYLSNSLQTGTKRLRKVSRSSSTLNVDLALS